jgi:hypothetical protein
MQNKSQKGRRESEPDHDQSRRGRAKRAQAYRDMEPHLCDVGKMRTIAAQLFNDPNRELYDFAVGSPFGSDGRTQHTLLRVGIPELASTGNHPGRQ